MKSELGRENAKNLAFFFIIIIIFKYYLCPFPSLMDLSIHYSKITLNGCEIRDLTEANRGSELWFSNPSRPDESTLSKWHDAA